MRDMLGLSKVNPGGVGLAIIMGISVNGAINSDSLS